MKCITSKLNVSTYARKVCANMAYITVIVLLMGNCSKDKIWQDDDLSLSRSDYNGNQLRVDGYFYQERDGYFYTMYCLYTNGMLLYLGGGFSQAEVIELEDRIRNGSFYASAKEFKNNWGVFNIENNTIKFEKWYAGDPPLKAYVRAGEIINDTTFVINESYRMQGGKKTEVRAKAETYHFKAFSPKPDSTNKFIP